MRWSVVALWTGLIGCAGSVTDGPPDQDTAGLPPNLLLIVLDDVGRDALSTWTDDVRAAPMPNLDRLAADGVRFRQAWSNPVCAPSRAALLTGRHARRTGIGGAVPPGSEGYSLPLQEELIPEVLARAPVPYRSVAVGKWHLATEGTGGTSHPTDQGFEHFRGTAGNLDLSGDVVGEAGTYDDWAKITDGVVARRQAYATSDVVDDALELITPITQPWFLYVAFHAGHAPYHTPPDALTGLGLRANAPEAIQYRAMLTALDTELGRLLDGLDPGTRARTVVVVMGDNGTPPAGVLPPNDPRRAKRTLFEGGVGVPFLISGDGIGTGDVQAPIHLVDVLPTLAGLAGVPEDRLPAVLDGIDLAPWLTDPGTPSTGRTIHAEYFEPSGFPVVAEVDILTARDDRWKLGRVVGEGEVLFDLLADPTESRSLLPAEPGSEADVAARRLAEAMDDRLDASLSAAR